MATRKKGSSQQHRAKQHLKKVSNRKVMLKSGHDRSGIRAAQYKEEIRARNNCGPVLMTDFHIHEMTISGQLYRMELPPD